MKRWVIDLIASGMECLGDKYYLYTARSQLLKKSHKSGHPQTRHFGKLAELFGAVKLQIGQSDRYRNLFGNNPRYRKRDFFFLLFSLNTRPYLHGFQLYGVAGGNVSFSAALFPDSVVFLSTSFLVVSIKSIPFSWSW